MSNNDMLVHDPMCESYENRSNKLKVHRWGKIKDTILPAERRRPTQAVVIDKEK